MKRWWLCMLVLTACLALSGCQKQQAPAPGGLALRLDGEATASGSIDPDAEGLRVYVTLDGAPLIDLPFDEAHTLTVEQPGVGQNTVVLTGNAVYMESADCEGQDCVQMGEVTAENLELRVMGGFIVCLPHRLSVEVREP